MGSDRGGPGCLKTGGGEAGEESGNVKRLLFQSREAMYCVGNGVLTGFDYGLNVRLRGKSWVCE